MANDGCPSCTRHGHTIRPMSRLASCDHCPAVFDVDTRAIVAEFTPAGLAVAAPAKKAARKPAKKASKKKASKKAVRKAAP